MTALGTLYEEVNAKGASYVVRVAGTSYPVESLSYNFAMGEVPSALFEIRNPLPAPMVYGASVEIYTGYNGLLQLIFTGQIETPTPGSTTTTMECSGLSRKLRIPYKRLVRVLSGQDANDIVEGMLDDAGVTNYAVNLEPWVVGAIVTTTLEFQTWDDGINKVASVDGSPWYELPTGQIRVELRDPWPAPSFFRQYYSGDLRNLTDAERVQWIAGTLPLTAIQPAGIVNANAQPRVRDGIRQTTLRSNVRNQIYVLGAVIDTAGPNGETISTRIEARALSPVPWIPNGRLDDWVFDNELIDTQAKANTVAARKFSQQSRLDQRVALSVDGDPEIMLGMTVNVEDPAYTGITGNWFVYGYQGRMDRSGYVLQLDLRGGVNAGITPMLAPVADFLFANEYTPFAKVKQVTPATTGAVIVTFDGRSSFDPDGTIASWAWSDDQGNTGTGSVIQFDYNQALSSIQMTLTVTDNDGLTDSITKTVNIATSGDSCGDAGTCVIFAAIKTHMSVSEDGGASWTDVSKAAALATGDFISVGQSNGQFVSFIPQAGDPSDAVVAIFGTSAGEFYRTDDALGSTTKYTIPSGRPIVGIWVMSPPYTFEWWFIADDAGNVYVFVYRVDNGDYGMALYHSDGKLTVNFALVIQSTILADFPQFQPLTEGVLIGGDSSDPDTMIRRVVGSLSDQSSVGNTFGWGLASPARPSPVPAFTGAIRDAIIAAGAGHSAQAVAGFIYFETVAGLIGGQTTQRFGVMFTSGVDPRVWFHDGTAWQPATGLTPAINGKYLVGGFDIDFLLAVLAQLKTFSAEDGVTFIEGTTGSPSQINHVVWETGLLGVYLGAAASGIVKSLDAGDNWGYIRPHAGVGTTWPVGAEGKQVAISFKAAPPCPYVYSLSRTGGASDNLLNLAGSRWQLIENTRSGDAFGLQYLGGGGRMIHLVDDDVPQISFDYGLTWQASNTPPVGYPICSAIAMDAAGERLWGLWRDGNTITADSTAIAYSTDWGDTWVIADEDTTAQHYYQAIACHPTDVARIVVTGAHTLTGFTWKTTDRGVTWAQAAGPALQNGLVYHAHNAPSPGLKSQNVVFSPYGRLIWSTGGRTATPDVYYSDDYGATWTNAIYAVSPPFGEGMVHLMRCGPFGPYYSLHFDRNAASTPIFRSDDHGAHWVAVAPPDADDDYNGMAYDPLTNVVLFHRDDASEVWALDPVSGEWTDVTYNYNSLGANGPVTQPMTFVGDPADAGP